MERVGLNTTIGVIAFRELADMVNLTFLGTPPSGASLFAWGTPRPASI